MDILSIVMASFSLICYTITMISFRRQTKKEDAQKVQEKVELRDDVKHTRQRVDELYHTMQELSKQSNQHDTILAQHEIRITALEHWKDSHYKE